MCACSSLICPSARPEFALGPETIPVRVGACEIDPADVSYHTGVLSTVPPPDHLFGLVHIIKTGFSPGVDRLQNNDMNFRVSRISPPGGDFQGGKIPAPRRGGSVLIF